MKRIGLRPWRWIEQRIPQLKWYLRVLLYLATAGVSTLSIVQAGMRVFQESIGIIIYLLAGVFLAGSGYYLYKDIRYHIWRGILAGINAHPIGRRMTEDYRYRSVLATVPSVLVNFVYTLYNGIFGVRNRSVWFITMAIYYSLLAGMRGIAVRQEHRLTLIPNQNERTRRERSVLRLEGYLFLLLTVSLSGSVYLMVTYEYAKKYPEIIVIAIAAYTFYKIIMAAVNVVRARKMKAPLLTAIRNIGYADAMVSLLSLQTSMYICFGTERDSKSHIMNMITGAVVCLTTFALGISMMVSANKTKCSEFQG